MPAVILSWKWRTQTACTQPHGSFTAQVRGAFEFYVRLPCGGHHWRMQRALFSRHFLYSRLDSTGFQHLRAGEWVGRPCPCAPGEGPHLDATPQRPLKASGEHQPSWRDWTQGQVKWGVLPSPLPPPVPRRCLGLKDGARKSWSLGLDLNLKIGLSYCHQNWPEIYTIHPRCFLKSEDKFSNPAITNLSNLMDHKTRMSTLSLFPFNKIEGRTGFLKKWCYRKLLDL